MKTWEIIISISDKHTNGSQKDALWDAVANAAYDWEMTYCPDREGWGIELTSDTIEGE